MNYDQYSFTFEYIKIEISIEMFKVIVLCVIFAVAFGSPIEHHGHEDHHVDYYAYPKYKFQYGVEDHHTGDHHSHWEERDGDVVKGEYTLFDSDGTKRVVEYKADKHSGFEAVVKKIGHEYHHHEAPAQHVHEYHHQEAPAQHAHEYHHQEAPAQHVHEYHHQETPAQQVHEYHHQEAPAEQEHEQYHYKYY